MEKQSALEPLVWVCFPWQHQVVVFEVLAAVVRRARELQGWEKNPSRRVRSTLCTFEFSDSRSSSSFLLVKSATSSFVSSWSNVFCSAQPYVYHGIWNTIQWAKFRAAEGHLLSQLCSCFSGSCEVFDVHAFAEPRQTRNRPD